MAPPLVSARALEVPGRLAPTTFEVPAGACLALLGPNGAGKSTCLDALLGLVPARGGLEVRARTVKVVPQRLEAPLALPLTVLDFLALSRARWPVALGGGRRAAGAALDAAGLGALGRRPLGGLSGGELRRVLLADALGAAPELLLLDEPEVGLDAAGRAWLDGALGAALAGGAGVLLVSHDAGLRARATHRQALEAPGG